MVVLSQGNRGRQRFVHCPFIRRDAAAQVASDDLVGPFWSA